MSFRIKQRAYALYVLCMLIAPALCLGQSASATTCPALPAANGTATITFTVKSAGSYRLWTHVHSAPSGNSDLSLTVDQGCPIAIGGNTLSANSVSWVSNTLDSTAPVMLQLSKGSHTLVMAGQEPSIGIDQVLLLTSDSCIPAGGGNNCLGLAGVLSTQPTSGQSETSSATIHNTVKLALYLIASVIAITFTAFGLSRLLKSTSLRPGGQAQSQPLASAPLQPATPSQLSYGLMPALATPSAPLPATPPRVRKHWILLGLGFCIVAGVAILGALSFFTRNVMVDLSNAEVADPAYIVASPEALGGSLVQFGGVAGSAAAATPPSPTLSATSHGHTSSTPSGGSGAKAGSGSGSSSIGSGGSIATISITSSTCTNPNWNTSDAEGTDNTDSNDVWWVNNDAWSASHGPQSIYVCNQSSWYATSNQTDHGGAVETYPDTEYDVAGRGNATKTIAQYKAITSNFSENFPAAGSWDAAYDLWLNNWSKEIMIWNQWTGTQLYWPSDKSVTVNLGGVPYWFQSQGGDEYIFFRQTMVSSGSVDILAAFNYLVSKGLVKSTDIPTQLEYGVEICSTNGNETFPMTGLTFTLN